jgi:glycosyltransferase involved in cell wall biosynthesis
MSFPSKLKVCYFGNYKSDFSRNRIFQSGLRQHGVQIIGCQNMSKGLGKYFNLWRQHQKIKDDYDVMIVGYPGHIVAPFAKIISRKKVILDALCSLYEGEIISRQSASRWSFRRLKIWLIDWLAYHFADLILVETEAQKNFFRKKFFVQQNKLEVVYTGADDSVFYPDQTIKKKERFTAVFRGRFLPEAGVEVVVQAAKLLEKEGIDILIIGSGLEQEKITKLISELNPTNLTLESRIFSTDELRRTMLSCHVSLGQFANHERLSRTIPHKAFESLALKLPYITSDCEGIIGVLTTGKNCLLCRPNNSRDLADSILLLRNDQALALALAEKGYADFKNLYSPQALGENLLTILKKTI